MNLKELANKIDKSSDNEAYIDLDVLGEELGVGVYGMETEGALKSYWLGSWLCTDTQVGYKLYFLKDKPVALSIQGGRKMKEAFKWFSKDVAKEVKKYLLTLLPDEGLNVEVWDTNQDIGESYKIEYNSELFNTHTNKVSYRGEATIILELVKERNYDLDNKVKIKYSTNEVKIVDIKDLDFSYNIR